MSNHDGLQAVQRRQAKTGMAIALGTLVATGLMSGKETPWASKARTLHLCAGVALVGFSCWHWSLYHKRNKANTTTPPVSHGQAFRR